MQGTQGRLPRLLLIGVGIYIFYYLRFFDVIARQKWKAVLKQFLTFTVQGLTVYTQFTSSSLTVLRQYLGSQNKQ